MGYHQTFKATRLFRAFVEPYLDDLHHLQPGQPLILEYNLEDRNSATFQWHNYFHHHCPGEYTLRTIPNPATRATFLLTIKHASAIPFSRRHTQEASPLEDLPPHKGFSILDNFTYGEKKYCTNCKEPVLGNIKEAIASNLCDVCWVKTNMPERFERAGTSSKIPPKKARPNPTEMRKGKPSPKEDTESDQEGNFNV